MPAFKNLSTEDLIKGINARLPTPCREASKYSFLGISPAEKYMELKAGYKPNNMARGAYSQYLFEDKTDVEKVKAAAENLEVKKLKGTAYKHSEASLKMHLSINDFGKIDEEVIYKIIDFLYTESGARGSNIHFTFKIIKPLLVGDIRYKDNDQFTLYFDKYSSTADFIQLAEKINTFLQELKIPKNASKRGYKDTISFNSFVSARFDTNKIHDEYAIYSFFDKEIDTFIESNLHQLDKLNNVPLCAFEIAFNDLILNKPTLIPRAGERKPIPPENSEQIKKLFAEIVKNPKAYMQRSLSNSMDEVEESNNLVNNNKAAYSAFFAKLTKSLNEEKKQSKPSLKRQNAGIPADAEGIKPKKFKKE